MSMLRVQIRGVKKLNKYLINLPRKISNELASTNQQFIDLVVLDAKNYAPVDTGQLKHSIEKVPVRQGKNVKQWKIVVHSPYGIFQELGFRPHEFFANPNSGFNSSKMSPWRTYLVKKNTPFIVPAIDKNLTNLTEQLNKAIGRAIK